MPKSLKQKIIFTKIGYTMFFLIVPLLALNRYYGLFDFRNNTKTTIKITGALVLAALIIWFFLRNLIKKGINLIAPGWTKRILSTLYASAPIIAIWMFIEMSIDNLLYFIPCMRVITFSMVIANILDSIYDELTQEWNEIKLTKRQDKYRRKYNL